MMFSKYVYGGVICAVATMSLLACQPAFKMACDPTKERCSDNYVDKRLVSPTNTPINTSAGKIQMSAVSAVAVPPSNDGGGNYGSVQLTFSISGDGFAARNISVNASLERPGTIPSQGKEPQMTYTVRCANIDPSCATMDIGVYSQVSGREVQVLAVRVNSSNILTSVFTNVDGAYVLRDDPTSAIVSSQMPAYM